MSICFFFQNHSALTFTLSPSFLSEPAVSALPTHHKVDWLKYPGFDIVAGSVLFVGFFFIFLFLGSFRFLSFLFFLSFLCDKLP